MHLKTDDIAPANTSIVFSRWGKTWKHTGVKPQPYNYSTE